jgi:hypothetical protein
MLYINSIIKDGLEGIQSTCKKMNEYPNKGPRGQFTWIKDVDRANKLYDNIVNGWHVYDAKKVEL